MGCFLTWPDWGHHTMIILTTGLCRALVDNWEIRLMYYVE